jgi:phage-related protein
VGMISSLTRVGVTFTDSQQKTIAAMVKSGNTIGAQKVILGELNKEFGGSAKAYGETLPGEIARGKRAFEDFSQNLVTKLIPILTKVVTFITGTVIPGIQKLWTDVQPYIAQFVAYWQSTIWPAIQQLWVKIQPLLANIGAAFASAFALIQAVVQTAVAVVMDIWDRFGGQMLGHLQAAFGQIQAIFSGAFAVIQGIFQLFTDLLTGKWSKLWGDLTQIVSGIWKVISNVVSLGLNALSALIGLAMAEISAIWAKIWGTISSAASSAWNSIKSVVGGGISTVKTWIDTFVGYFTGLPARFAGKFSGLFDGIKNAFRSAINWVIDKWNGLSFSIPGVNTHIPGVGKIGGFTLGTPNIPRLAAGGIDKASRGGTLALLGEGGHDEMVTPLNGRNGGGITVNVTVQGSVQSEQSLVEAIYQGLLKTQRRNGGLGFA